MSARPATAVAWQTTGTAVPGQPTSLAKISRPTGTNAWPGDFVCSDIPTAVGAVCHATAVAGFPGRTIMGNEAGALDAERVRQIMSTTGIKTVRVTFVDNSGVTRARNVTAGML